MSTSKLSGLAIVAGGTSLIIVNIVFAPMLAQDISYTELMASSAYLWRLALATLSVMLLMVGCSGLHAHQKSQSGLFGSVAFSLAFLGSALLFAHEWGQVFYIHNVAVIAPAALQAIEDAEGLNLFDIEGLIAFLTFTLGWIAFAAAMLRAGVFSRLGPILVIVGFFATPLITAVTSPGLGSALGNLVLGSGFILLGRELFKSA